MLVELSLVSGQTKMITNFLPQQTIMWRDFLYDTQPLEISVVDTNDRLDKSFRVYKLRNL